MAATPQGRPHPPPRRARSDAARCSCARRARRRSPASACMPKTPPEARRWHARRAARPQRFGPRWLQQRLAQLLPQFPQTAAVRRLQRRADSTALLAALARCHARPRSSCARCTSITACSRTRGAGARTAAASRARWACRSRCARAHVSRARAASRSRPPRAQARYALLGAALARRRGAAHRAPPGRSARDRAAAAAARRRRRRARRHAGGGAVRARPAGAAAAAARRAPSSAPGCSAQGLTWIEDESNAQRRLDRNYLRARVLPLIRARWPRGGGDGGAQRASRRPKRSGCSMRSARPTSRAPRCGRHAVARGRCARLTPDRRRNALRFWISAAGPARAARAAA